MQRNVKIVKTAIPLLCSFLLALVPRSNRRACRQMKQIRAIMSRAQTPGGYRSPPKPRQDCQHQSLAGELTFVECDGEPVDRVEDEVVHFEADHDLKGDKRVGLLHF